MISFDKMTITETQHDDLNRTGFPHLFNASLVLTLGKEHFGQLPLLCLYIYAKPLLTSCPWRCAPLFWCPLHRHSTTRL